MSTEKIVRRRAGWDPQWQLVSPDVHWHAPGDGWLMAHDLYHHEPNDQGSLAEELLTFGVQHWLASPWMKQESLVPSDLMSETCFSDALTATLDASIVHLDLPQPPEVSCDLDIDWLTAWREDAEAVMGSMGSNFGALDDAPEPDPRCARWGDPTYLDRLVGWVAVGFARGQIRYPDPTPIQAAFDELGKTLDQALQDMQVGDLIQCQGSLAGGWTWSPMKASVQSKSKRRRSPAS